MADLWKYEVKHSESSRNWWAEVSRFTPSGEVYFLTIHGRSEPEVRGIAEQVVLLPQAMARIQELETKLKDCQQYSQTLIDRLEEEKLL